MGMPTAADRALSAIDDLHHVILARLRGYHFSGRTTDPNAIREALQQYADAVVEFINNADHG